MPEHPLDRMRKLLYRIEPFHELAYHLTVAEHRGFKWDNYPPLSAELAEALIEFRNDMSDARREMEEWFKKFGARADILTFDEPEDVA